ncbi:hypothetical protein QTI66_21305 [Variovorax sp. J22R133]|uniref:hypothetical protein n=1 Tax=Variovorax brevis TaxID=3053503 RepID=UPI00257551CA|nr:hypothetical protein [Variovorax sp. J22R133]MDM0114704.1 hypothetical protein [Variovorax sp. J22R133]
MSEPKIQPLSLFASGGAAAKSDPWTRIPYADVPRFDARTVLAKWTRLQAGQGKPAQPCADLAEGWALYHSGDFEQAAAIGLQHGPEGLALANRAVAIYANYLEPREAVRLTLFRQVADRTAAQIAAEPDNCQALYWHAYSLGRYSQGISVARALAQGLGGKVKATLERVIALQPEHADAHVSLGVFHAEVIDKVGPLVARMTYGARADTAVALFERGLALNPDAPGNLMEYANGLLMIYGDSRQAEAKSLFEKAAAFTPADARERLDVELAKAGLAD